MFCRCFVMFLFYEQVLYSQVSECYKKIYVEKSVSHALRSHNSLVLITFCYLFVIVCSLIPFQYLGMYILPFPLSYIKGSTLVLGSLPYSFHLAIYLRNSSIRVKRKYAYSSPFSPVSPHLSSLLHFFYYIGYFKASYFTFKIHVKFIPQNPMKKSFNFAIFFFFLPDGSPVVLKPCLSLCH